jgi:hypothetical protein
MNTNYFKTLLEAKKHADKTEKPHNTHIVKGSKYVATNEQGEKIYTIRKIDNIMGWLLSFYPNNLKINKTN